MKTSKNLTTLMQINFNAELFLLMTGFIASLFITAIGFYFKQSITTITTLAAVNIVLGILYANFRIEKNSSGYLISLFILIFSFVIQLVLLSFYGDSISTQIWFFILLTVVALYGLVITPLYNEEKVTPKLGEGTTLLQSISFIYLVLELNIRPQNLLETIVAIVFFLLMAFSVIHALTSIKLSTLHRFILSIWSSFIMLTFSIDYIYRTLVSKNVEFATNVIEAVNLGVEYFLFGVASIYFLNNALMMVGFLPIIHSLLSTSTISKSYKDNITILKNRHIKRYSSTQVITLHSIICILTLVALFYFNHIYEILPRHVATWIAFIVFPISINLITKKTSEKAIQIQV